MAITAPETNTDSPPIVFHTPKPPKSNAPHPIPLHTPAFKCNKSVSNTNVKRTSCQTSTESAILIPFQPRKSLITSHGLCYLCNSVASGVTGTRVIVLSCELVRPVCQFVRYGVRKFGP